MQKKRLLILGGGFAGLDVARSIGKSKAAREYWDTLLIDKENFFQFNPLLPAVAVGAVETRHIVYPLRDMARHRQIRFFKNKATRIDLVRREVLLHNDLIVPYDTLVIAAGSVTNYYSVPGAQEHTRPFKTIVDAMYVRARVVELFEMAEQAETAEQRRKLLAFVIVGGGVTGVEVAAEMVDMAHGTLLPKFPSVRASDVSVTIIEVGDRIIPAARPEHSAYVQRFLVRRGVKLLLGHAAARVEPKRVHLADGSSVDAFTIIWTAGVRPPDLIAQLPVLHVKDGRVRVDEYLRALDPTGTPIEDVFVGGDCAASPLPDGGFQPTLSQTGVAMGTHIGGLLVRRAKGRPATAFRFQSKGYIISLGKHSSVLELFGVPLSGKLAWLLWAAAYLVKMVGIRKQLEVGIDHLTHLIFEHDYSQILNRRQILSDEELNLSLGAEPASRPAEPASRSTEPDVSRVTGPPTQTGSPV
ncbi:MAG TPA: NAD(P)/FAD-dependent oxidoreductase [Candidatus Eisenbacteria bacterium]|nr:NAD(P)/FAD-dependent oxidoreductase [Candidatus Eisenbacteria bacterium]